MKNKGQRRERSQEKRNVKITRKKYENRIKGKERRRGDGNIVRMWTRKYYGK